MFIVGYSATQVAQDVKQPLWKLWVTLITVILIKTNVE